jgi:DNA-binding XRE family transcriptional regulator
MLLIIDRERLGGWGGVCDSGVKRRFRHKRHLNYASAEALGNTPPQPESIHIGLFLKRHIKSLMGCIYTLIVAYFLAVSKVVNMITSRQIRAARALLDWSQQQLADAAIVSLNAVARLEKGIVDSRTSTLLAIQKALVKAGIEFLDADQKGEGVRLKSPKS